MTFPGNYGRVTSTHFSPIFFFKLTVGWIVGARTTGKVQEHNVTRRN